MKLSKNFHLTEFTSSATAIARNIDNTPNEVELSNLRCTALGLEMVRKLLFDEPILIHSGFRCEALNEAVGGTDTSDHRHGWAADITVATYRPLEVAHKIAGSFIAFDQLIHEPSRGIVHISFNPKLRNQLLTQRGGPGSTIIAGIHE